jgi:DNA polymerase I-like protein with 3'-5' exonuclease and polymerase domains
MSRVFIDVAGLTTTADPEVLISALNLQGERIEESERLPLLARLQHGAGVVILTGPEGAAFWSIVSPEVKVRVMPDDVEYNERVAADSGWAYRAVGFDAAASNVLLKRKTPLPAKDRRFRNWLRAGRLLQGLVQLGECEPLISEDFPAKRWTVDEGQAILDSDALLVVDGEWDIGTGNPTGVALGDAAEAGYVPVWASDYRPEGNDPDAPHPESGGQQIRNFVTCRLDSGLSTIMHGGRADLNALYTGNPLDLVGKAELDDTMVMAYLCGEPLLALKELTRKYLRRDPVDFPGNLSELPVALGTRYAAADARNTYDLYSVFGRTLAERNQWGVYREIERPLVPVIAAMERQGVPLDIDEVKRLYRDFVAIEQGVRYAILDHYGLDVAQDNGKTLESNQARQFVALVRGADPGTLDQRVLTMFPEGEIDLLLLHRRSRTVRRNFLGRALRYHHAITHPQSERRLFKAKQRFTAKGQLTDWGQYLAWKQQWEALDDKSLFRYFPRFNQAGSMDQENRAAPRSGRLSSSGPNFQNQTRNIRSIYVPPAGHVWWSFDYSGLELHIAAAVSGDKEMRRILDEKCPEPRDDGSCPHKPKHGDLHGYLQYQVQAMTGQMYDRAVVVKPFNFMELYGGSPAKGVEIVAKSRNYITLEVAQQIDAGHHAAFPDFWEWRGGLLVLNRNRGYGETIFGRRRYIPEYRSRDSERQSYADRAGANHVIQGTASDIVKMAMVLVVPILLKYGAHMCAQVHDELDGWIKQDADLPAFKREMEDALTSIPLPGGVKLKVEGGFGPTWGDAH